MPTSSLHPAAGHCARFAAPTIRSLVLVAVSMILTACGDGSLFADNLGGSGKPPSSTPGNSPGNDAPSISGKPQAIATVNQPYFFKPDAYDPDGDVLIFQVTRLPPWATFNPATGEITGVPPTGATGTFGDIQIAVTDGELKTALPTFAITVTGSSSAPPTGSGSATLSWTAPAQNDDGSPLGNLAGYRIYYGQSSGNLNLSIDISDAARTSIEISALAAGTWYFAMTSVNSNGVESRRTGVVMKVI